MRCAQTKTKSIKSLQHNIKSHKPTTDSPLDIDANSKFSLGN